MSADELLKEGISFEIPKMPPDSTLGDAILDLVSDPDYPDNDEIKITSKG